MQPAGFLGLPLPMMEFLHPTDCHLFSTTVRVTPCPSYIRVGRQNWRETSNQTLGEIE
jgi:hypothetical protein